MKAKIIALTLALVLALGCLSGCGGSAASSSAGAEATPAPTPESTPEATPEATEGPDKFALAYAKYSPDTVVLTVNGTPVTWDIYYCWLYTIVNHLEMYGAIDWSAELGDGYTYADYAREYAESMISQYVIIDDAAAELDIQLSEEEQAQLDAVLQQDADNSTGGDVDAFLKQLASMYIPEDYYYYTNTVAMYYYDIFEHYFGENGSDLSDEDVLAFANDSGYMYAKHILFKTVDDAGTALDEAAVAEKRAAAEDVVARLNACATQEEKVALFDQLMAEESEDPGTAYYPDGYYFLEGEMVESFENAVKELEEGGFSDIVESDYGFHIIFRPAMDPDGIVQYDSSGNAYTLRYAAATTLFDNMSAEWFNDMDLVYADEFAALDLNALFAA